MPSPGSYTDIFGGNNVYPSQPSYLLLSPLTASVQLGWPIETAPAGQTVVADIIDVSPSTGGLHIQFSDATQVSEGYTALINNIGANSLTITDFSGNVIATVASGTVWQLYLFDNTTQNGSWRAFQFGAGVSQATAAALAGAGLVAITTTLNQNYTFNNQNTNYNAVLGDRSRLINWTGGAGSLVLPNNGTIPAGWFTMSKNSGSGVLTITVTGGATIDGSSALNLNPEQSTFLLFDGNNFVTLGLGQEINSIFDFLAIDLTGATGNVVLSGAQLNRISYRFTGALAGNVNIIVPNTIQQYWIDNETTGAFTLAVKTGAGTGVIVGQSTHLILYCDGTNVINAVSAAINLPITIAQGGTNATTAGAALTNLGGGAVGVPVFQASTQAAALTALGIAFSGALVTNGNQVIPSSASPSLMTWSGATTNSGPWWAASPNPSRLTVPAGITFAEISASLSWDGGGGGTTSFFQGTFEIRKNGATIVSLVTDSLNQSKSGVASIASRNTYITTGPLAVTPGDYFEVLINLVDPATGTLLGGNLEGSATSFQARALY